MEFLFSVWRFAVILIPLDPILLFACLIPRIVKYTRGYQTRFGFHQNHQNYETTAAWLILTRTPLQYRLKVMLSRTSHFIKKKCLAQQHFQKKRVLIQDEEIPRTTFSYHVPHISRAFLTLFPSFLSFFIQSICHT